MFGSRSQRSLEGIPRQDCTTVMTDLKNPRLIYLKGFVFLVIGLLAAALLILERPTAKVAFLLAVAIWAFARLYYFMFYVIEHYVDPTYKFAGIWSFVRYVMRRYRSGRREDSPR
jgi:hypothetical protein